MNGNNKNVSATKIINSYHTLQNIGEKLSDFEEIPNSEKNYTLLGKGYFGYVEKMKSKKNNLIYAIKKIDKNNKKFNEINLIREIEIMMNLKHANLVKLYGCFKDIENINKYKEIYSDSQNLDEEKKNKEIYCLVLEYIQNGSLEDYYEKHMEKYKNKYVPIEQNFIIKILKQSLSVLVYFLQKSILHRDIKSDNILLDENNNIKISDFGISALFYDKNPENLNKNSMLFSDRTLVGRKDVVPPEILNGEKFDFKGDIFNLGLTMLCLMSRKYPIELTRINGELERKNINRENIDDSYNIYLKKLILRMTEDNCANRPYAHDAFQELQYIEDYIKNPNNNQVKNYLDNINNQNKQNMLNNQNIQNNQNFINNQNNQMNQNIPVNQNINNNLNLQNNFLNNNNQAILNNQNSQFNQNNINFNNNLFMNNIFNQNNNNNFQNIQRNFQQNFLYNNIFPNNQFNQFGFPMNMNMQNQFHQNKMFYPIPNDNIMNNQNLPNNMSLSSDNMNINNNTSFIRVLQCLYYIMNKKFENLRFLIDNMHKTIDKNNCFSKDIINAFELFKDKFENKKTFINAIQNCRKKFGQKLKIFQGSDEMRPIDVFTELFKNLNDELIQKNIPWNNLIFNNYSEPQSSLGEFSSQIKTEIKLFTEEYNGPFVDMFYYIFLTIIKCENCDYIIRIGDSMAASYIPLPSYVKGNINDLIKNYFRSIPDPDEYFCINCNSNNVRGKKQKVFINSPKYLIIYFEGGIKLEKNLEKNLDLTDYILTDVGPKKYELYAFIYEENYKFKAFIKNYNWKIYSEYNNISDSTLESFNGFAPYIAIYRGLH